MKRRVKLLGLMGLVTFVTVMNVSAGGWSVITLKDVPDYAVAGKPIMLTFTVRQHGNNLLDGLKPGIRATTSGGVEVKAMAHATGNSGEYAASLVFDKPGEWTIRIDGGFNPDDKARTYNSVTLAPLKVVAASAPLPADLANAARGERLFVAKGCIGCHRHADVNPERPGESRFDLTERRFPHDQLTQFLANPGITIREMSNLNLTEDEIAALAAFLNGL